MKRVKSLGLVDRFSADDGAQHAGMQKVGGRNPGDIAIEHDEIGQKTGREPSLFRFSKLGIGSAGRVGGNRLVNADLLLRHILLGTVFTLASDGGVKAAERRKGLDGKVGAEGEHYAIAEELGPGVGVRGTLAPDA